MSRVSKTTVCVPLLGALALFAGSAHAAGIANSASFNAGYGRTAGAENRTATGGTRDANGNRVIVNGMLGGGNMGSQSGVQQATTTGSGGKGNGSALAIGNSLNVQVTGSWNTVIVDSKQVNNGDQTAGVSLNGDLNL